MRSYLAVQLGAFLSRTSVELRESAERYGVQDSPALHRILTINSLLCNGIE